MFYREQAALMYDPYAVGIATLLCELPYVVTEAALFCPIVYWMVDFEHSAAKFWFFFLVTVVNLLM